MPFLSLAQSKKCFATQGFHGKVNCNEWARATDYKHLKKRVKKHKKQEGGYMKYRGHKSCKKGCMTYQGGGITSKIDPRFMLPDPGMSIPTDEYPMTNTGNMAWIDSVNGINANYIPQRLATQVYEMYKDQINNNGGALNNGQVPNTPLADKDAINPEKKRNDQRIDPYFALQNIKNGLAWLGEKKNRNRQDQYMYNQYSTLGQNIPVNLEDYQPNPFSLYSKYGGSMKKKCQKGGVLAIMPYHPINNPHGVKVNPLAFTPPEAVGSYKVPGSGEYVSYPGDTLTNNQIQIAARQQLSNNSQNSDPNRVIAGAYDLNGEITNHGKSIDENRGRDISYYQLSEKDKTKMQKERDNMNILQKIGAYFYDNNNYLPTPRYKGGGLSREEDYGSGSKHYPSVDSGDFAGGHRSYPIPTRADAIDALRLAHLHGRQDVIAKVHQRYPDLQQGGLACPSGDCGNKKGLFKRLFGQREYINNAAKSYSGMERLQDDLDYYNWGSGKDWQHSFDPNIHQIPILDPNFTQTNINYNPDLNNSNTPFAQKGGYKGGGWIKKAVNPAHKGYCTPMTKATCTPRRKAFAMTMKKHHGFHE